MYAYRSMTSKQKKQLTTLRKQLQRPLHAPPHFATDSLTYLLSAANYEHKPIMATAERRGEFEAKLLDFAINHAGAEIFAWCILPNHWHLMAPVTLSAFEAAISRLHNGTSTQWNREDLSAGRKVWYRFADRRIRNERHYWATLNYIHANPVHHNYTAKADEWISSSLHSYLDQYGYEHMVRLWRDYPIHSMGKGWDQM